MRDKDTQLIWEIFTSNKEIPPILTISAGQGDEVRPTPRAYWHQHKMRKKRKRVPKVVSYDDGSISPPVNQQRRQTEGNLTEDGDRPLRLDDSHILDDIKDLPDVFVKGLSLLKGLQALEDLPSGQHWSIGYERRNITKDLKNDLGSGLDRYYGQKEKGGGLVAKVIPGSSIYMDADVKTRKILPSETGQRAFALFFAHRKELLDHWTDREEPKK